MWLSRNNWDTGRGGIDDFYVFCCDKPSESFNRKGDRVQFMDSTSGITYIKCNPREWDKRYPNLKLKPGEGPFQVTGVGFGKDWPYGERPLVDPAGGEEADTGPHGADTGNRTGLCKPE